MADDNPYFPPQTRDLSVNSVAGRVLAGFKKLVVPAALALTLIIAGHLWGFVMGIILGLSGQVEVSDIQGAERVSMGLMIAGNVFFLVWFYRVGHNARLFAGRALDHTPGFAVGSFFIPFVNLAIPCVAALDFTAVTYRSLDRNPPRWLLFCWWFSFVISNFLMYFANIWPEAFAAVFGFRLIAVGFLVAMVSVLTSAQYRVLANPPPQPDHVTANPFSRFLSNKAPAVPGSPVGSALPPKRTAETPAEKTTATQPAPPDEPADRREHSS